MYIESCFFRPNRIHTDKQVDTCRKYICQSRGVSQVNAAAQALTEAMEALILRANTAELAALVAQAKEIQQGDYTEESWDALQNAIASAEEALDNPNLSQNDISGQKLNLQNAMNGLAVEGTLDKNNLEDGVYSVYGEMIKTNREEKSMSNDAINHYIKLTVEDGKYYLNMDFHGLAYLNKFGYLAELSYYDDGYTYGQYGTVEGTLIPATVLSTQKNADGSDLYDEFNQAGGSYEGKLYPDQIKFPLVADALADEDGYVPLHVFVPGHNIMTVYKNAAVAFSLQLSDLLFVQQIQGVVGNACHILMQIVVDHKLSELLVASHIGSNHHLIQPVGAVNEVFHADKLAFGIFGKDAAAHGAKYKLFFFIQSFQPLCKEVHLVQRR